MTEDALTTAKLAKQQIDLHEKECAYRYQQILDHQKTSDHGRKVLHEKIETGFDKVYTRLWAMAVMVIGAEAAVAWFFFTQAMANHQP